MCAFSLINPISIFVHNVFNNVLYVQNAFKFVMHNLVYIDGSVSVIIYHIIIYHIIATLRNAISFIIT